jgi:hypothetical protein
MPDYNNGEPWWIFARLDGEPVISLPKKRGNALEEIYTNPAWYGLVPNENLLDPAGLVKEKLDATSRETNVLQNFHITMGGVTAKQRSISNLYHATTYVAYGNGALRPASYGVGAATSNGRAARVVENGESLEKLLTWGKVIWKAPLPLGVTEDELRAAIPLTDSESGNVRVYLESRKKTVEFEVQRVAKLPLGADDPDPRRREDVYGIVAGDGTVPVWSAQAQACGVNPRVNGDAATGIQMAFMQGGYGHQESYDHPWTRWALLYSIVQIAQDAPEHAC